MDITVDACCVVGDNTSINKITVEADVLESENIHSGNLLAHHHIRRETGSAIRERQLKPVQLNQTYLHSSFIHPVAQW